MLKALKNNKSGIALTEFALILPMFMMLFIGGIELAWEAIQRQVTQQLATKAADYSARVRGIIDETDIYEIEAAVRLNTNEKTALENGRIIISSIQNNPDRNGQWIRWQRCIGKSKTKSAYGNEGKGRDDSSLEKIGPGPGIKAPAGSAFILVEVIRDYEPLITDAYFGAKTLRYETAYILRERNDLSIGNSAKLTSGEILKC